VSQDIGGNRIHVHGPLFINSRQRDVCDGLHKTRYCTCSGSCEKVYDNLGKEHWEEVKWILRYFIGIATHALCFGGLYTTLQGYFDSDMACDKVMQTPYFSRVL
jgi:hypothetical protein